MVPYMDIVSTIPEQYSTAPSRLRAPESAGRPRRVWPAPMVDSKCGRHLIRIEAEEASALQLEPRSSIATRSKARCVTTSLTPCDS